MQELSKPTPKLDDFPPKLRKLGLFMISSGQLMTIKEACEAISINYQTARDQILYSKKKGNDFHELVDKHVIEKLRNARPDIYKSLQQRAISGSLGHQKLFSEIVGDRKDKVEIDHRVTGFYAIAGPSPNIIPQDIIESDKINKPNGVQIIDVDYED